MTNATISGWDFKISDAASPETFNKIEEVMSISNLGKTNELVDATNFDSPNNTREYIAGLADGSEIEIEANFTDGTQQNVFITAANAQQTRNFKVVHTAVSPDKTYSFSAVCLAWVVNPSVDDRNTISFTMKVTGDITVT